MRSLQSLQHEKMIRDEVSERKIMKKKRFYNLFWGAKVTVQMRVLSAPTFFNKKIGICTQILYN